MAWVFPFWFLEVLSPHQGTCRYLDSQYLMSIYYIPATGTQQWTSICGLCPCELCFLVDFILGSGLKATWLAPHPLTRMLFADSHLIGKQHHYLPPTPGESPKWLCHQVTSGLKETLAKSQSRIQSTHLSDTNNPKPREGNDTPSISGHQCQERSQITGPLCS